MTEDEIFQRIASVLSPIVGADIEPTSERCRGVWTGEKGSRRTMQILVMPDQGYRTLTMRSGFHDETLRGTGPDTLIVCAYQAEGIVDWAAAWSGAVANADGEWKPGGYDGAFFAVSWENVELVASGTLS